MSTEVAALRKLRLLNAAHVLNNLRVPPGNRLEALKGDREGQRSIRINDQWRVCFTWTAQGLAGVEFWLNLQSQYDADTARIALQDELETIEPFAMA